MIHEVGDGLGNRLVFVDGIEQKNVVSADTEAGVIVRAHDPVRLIEDRLDLYPVYGDVKVVHCDRGDGVVIK